MLRILFVFFEKWADNATDKNRIFSNQKKSYFIALFKKLLNFFGSIVLIHMFICIFICHKV